LLRKGLRLEEGRLDDTLLSGFLENRFIEVESLLLDHLTRLYASYGMVSNK
jgi:hypothetical protein